MSAESDSSAPRPTDPQTALYHDAEPTTTHGSFTGFENKFVHRCRPTDAYTFRATAKAHKTMKGYVDKNVIIDRTDKDHEHASIGVSRWDQAVAARQIRPGAHEDCPLCGGHDEFHPAMFREDLLDGVDIRDTLDEKRRHFVVNEVLSIAETGEQTAETSTIGQKPFITLGYSKGEYNTNADLRSNWCEGPHQFGLRDFINGYPFASIYSVRQAENVSQWEVGERQHDGAGANRNFRLEGSIDGRNEPGVRIYITTAFDDNNIGFTDP